MHSIRILVGVISRDGRLQPRLPNTFQANGIKSFQRRPGKANISYKRASRYYFAFPAPLSSSSFLTEFLASFRYLSRLFPLRSTFFPYARCLKRTARATIADRLPKRSVAHFLHRLSSFKDVRRESSKGKNDLDDNFISSYRGARGDDFVAAPFPKFSETDISPLSLSRLRSD